VVGIRLNLIDAPDPQLDIEPWPALLKLLSEMDWQVRSKRKRAGGPSSYRHS
jgi:hypothetical protein